MVETMYDVRRVCVVVVLRASERELVYMHCSSAPTTSVLTTPLSEATQRHINKADARGAVWMGQKTTAKTQTAIQQ